MKWKLVHETSLKSRTIIVGRSFAPSTLLETQVNTQNEVFYVISLANVSEAAQSNNGQRLQQFMRDLSTLCHGHEPQVIVIPGHLDARRGAGLVQSFVHVLSHAIEQNVERAYIFEDDAQLHNSLLCSSSFRQHLWDSVPDTFTLIFAAHHVVQHSRTWNPLFQFSVLNESLGSYAWAIKHEHFSTLHYHWTEALQSDQPHFSPDLDISRPTAGIRSHLLDFPTIASHRSHTFSNTWNEYRKHVFDKPPIDMAFITREHVSNKWLRIRSQHMLSKRLRYFADHLADHRGVDVFGSQHSSCTGYDSYLSSGLFENRFMYLIDADYANYVSTEDVYDVYLMMLTRPYSPHLVRSLGNNVIFAFTSALLQSSGFFCHEIFGERTTSDLFPS